MTGKKPIVKLRVYRGKEINYDSTGKIKNENFLISVEHNSKMWDIRMKNLTLNGYCKVNVDSVWDSKEDGTYSERENTSDIKNEVENVFTSKKELKLTPEQMQIAELKAMVEKLTSESLGKGKKDKPKKEKVDTSDLKDEYEKVVGKKPFHGWSAEQLKEKIEEAKNK